MRFIGLILPLLLTVSAYVSAQYPDVTVRQIQEVPLDSLLLLDTLQCNPPRWTLQVSPLYGDTVTLTAVCAIPARVLDYTAGGFNLLLADTGSPAVWGGILVRPNTTDTTLIIQWGMLNVQPGDVIRFVGFVDEFPALSCASTTQIVPLLTIPLQILGTALVPPHTPVQISEFSLGGIPGGQVRYSTGERYEFMRVLLRDAYVISRELNNCVLGLVDSSGNVMYTYSARSSLQCPPYPIGTRLDSVRGFVISTSGTEPQRVYRIAITDTSDVVVTGVEELVHTGVLTHKLERTYPNPFNSTATIVFSVSPQSFIWLRVFDVLGREVAVLVAEPLLAGTYSIQWNTEGLPSGVYFCRLQTSSFADTKKLILLK